MIKLELAEWDFAALMVIVREAGGRLTQIDGSERVHGSSVVTSNGLVHDEVLAALAE
jgi:histidinol-phosphatase